ncbi:Linear gramicidin synthase subunit B (plasmid) [Streptomyces sp. enrichment culture]|uniref:amino acid adenylation domain-containing protein n=1 Tax=Streptomyces sp. enrichment culture TaxID=1795815 RepID=UPI003F55B0AD
MNCDRKDTAPVLLPADRPRRPGALPRCSAVARSVSGAPAGPGGPSRVEALTAAFAALLFRCTGQQDLSFARTGPDGTEQVRVTVTGESTPRRIAAALTTGPAAGPTPVALRFTTGDGPAAPGGPYELQLTVDGDGGLALFHDPDLFDAATAERLLGHFATLAEDALSRPDEPVATLRLLSDEELHRVLVEWNRTETDLPAAAGCLHEAFQAQAARRPGASALIHRGEHFTYERINTEANRLAHHLRALGVGPDVRVGLCLKRSPELLVGILGILKAGGAYVPLDPDYPTGRIAAMSEGTACTVTVTTRSLADRLPGGQTSPVLLGEDGTDLSALPGHDPEPFAGPDDLCYVIHTSGSTGAPKPIALEHRGVMNNLADLNSRFGAGEGDAVLSLSSPSFDMSVYEYLGITAVGGTLVVPDPDRVGDPAHWADLLRAHDVTVWNTAPALLELLVDHLEQSGADPVTSLRAAMLGGDWIPVPLPDRARRVAPRMRILALGGVTEASIHSTVYEIGEVGADWPSIPYGRPMANQRVYLLDDALQPVPPGVPGELYVAGTGVARCYLGRPELTAERFFTWTHAGVTERLYRTGDMARYGADGLIELLGRKDFQVKLNGLRIELGEIEAVLRSHPDVQQSAVLAHRGQLVAYVVTDAGERTGAGVLEALRELVERKLPAYMVPSALVPLDALPLTPNGKVDRKGLPEPEQAGAAYRAPAAGPEQHLAEVFADVLGLDRTGADDDFVTLGGDSVKAIQVVTRARARGLAVTPRQVLELRTVAALAAASAPADEPGRPAADGPLTDVDDADLAAFRRAYPGFTEVWPLTPMQSGMLFESMLGDSGADTYQLQTVYHLTGPVDADRLRAAGQALLDRHAALRVAFAPDASGELRQIAQDGIVLPWQEKDLGDLTDPERDEALARFLAEDRARRFDVATAPLLRMTLVRTGPERAVLVLTTHHAVLDGWSEQVIARELPRLYAAGGRGDGPAHGYRSYLAWLNGQDREESARAWAEELAGLDGPTLVAPEAGVRPAAAEVGEITLPLAPGETAGFGRAAAALGVTVNTLVQGAWAVLVSQLSGRRDVVFGAAVSGRPGTLPGVESMVGLFINTLPVRVRCAPGDTVATMLTGLQRRQTALLDHHHHGLTDIHQAVGLDALFDTLVAFQSFPADEAGTDEAVRAAGFEVTSVDSVGGANYPLALIVEDGRLTLQYQPHLFDRTAAGEIAARFHRVLRQLADDPERRLASVDVLLPAERDLFTARHAVDDGLPAEDGESVVELFRRQAAVAPGTPALTGGDTPLTYRELDELTDRAARGLTRLGAGPGTVVALALPRSPELAVALLATAKAGAGWVLTDPAADPARRAAALVQAQPELAVTAPGAAPDPAFAALPTVSFDRLTDDAGAPAPAPDVPAPPPRQLAWVRYPAGGPDGAAVPWKLLNAEVRRFAAVAGIAPGDRVLALSGHVDAAALEILGALCAGATAEVPRDLAALSAQGWQGEVISTSAPRLAGILDRTTAPLRVRTAVLTGEVLLGSLVRRIRERIAGVRVVHAYGTAATVPATALTTAEGHPDTGPVPLGGPLAPVRAYVLGAGLQLLPPGVTGELYLAGDLALGYQGQAALTARRFVADPYGPPGSRMFRTGDLARWSADGELEYAGHTGDLVRISGRPVHTGDVEAALAAHPEVSRATVTARPGPDGGPPELAGYAVPLPDAAPTEQALRDFVADRLPAHMVPTTVTVLPDLPLTPEGTVDHRALPEPGTAPAADGPRPGRTPQEEALCALFAEILGVERVGIDDDFFALGGNSLKATRLIGRMRKTLGLEASIRTLFQYSTIAEFSGHVQAAAATGSRPRLRKMTKE